MTRPDCVPPVPDESFAASREADAPGGRASVTRAGVFVDRSAGAWPIRRFIDPGAALDGTTP